MFHNRDKGLIWFVFDLGKQPFCMCVFTDVVTRVGVPITAPLILTGSLYLQ